MQSLNNQSNVSLRPNGIYIGSWDDILQYQNIQINLKASTNCQITYYESNDKVLINETTYSYVGNDIYFNSINSTSRYVYFTVRNTTNVQQTNFNFSVLYKQSPTSNSDVGSDVNIVSPVDGSGYVEVAVKNLNLDVSGNAGVNVQNTVDTDIFSLLNNQRQTAQVWEGDEVAQNEVSSSINPASTSYCNTTLSCYGSSTESAVIAIQFSNDNTTFYTTQYQYTLSAGDFGFSIPCSASAIRLKLLSPTTSTLVAYINIC